MGYKSKLKEFIILGLFIFLFIKPLFGLYYLNVNIKNCDNLLIYYEESSSKNLENIQQNKSNIAYYLCLYFQNNEELCYPIYLSDLIIFMPPIGFNITDYVTVSMDKLPVFLIVRDYNRSVICTARINACIKDDICNEKCSFDPDCKDAIKIYPSNITYETGIKYYDISRTVLMAIAIISLIIIIVWKLTR